MTATERRIMERAAICLRFYASQMAKHGNDAGKENATYPAGQAAEAELSALLAADPRTAGGARARAAKALAVRPEDVCFTKRAASGWHVFSPMLDCRYVPVGRGATMTLAVADLERRLASSL